VEYEAGISEMMRIEVARYEVVGFDVAEPKGAVTEIAGS
jgi:hypothetical protein